MDVVYVVNIGATTTRLAAVTRGMELITQIKFPTRPGNYMRGMHELGQRVNDLASLVRHQYRGQVINMVSVGACVAGCVRDGIITGSGNLVDWRGKNLGRSLQNIFGRGPSIPVLNDCQAEGLGEYSAYGFPLYYIGWGTGVGISVVTHQQDNTAYSRPTELGHMMIDRSGNFKCGCGGFGHLEALIGGTNLDDRFGGWQHMSDADWDVVLDDLAVGCNNLSLGDAANQMPIVIGGGIGFKRLSRQGANQLDRLQMYVDRKKTTMTPPRLLLAQHGEDSALHGVAHAAWQQVTAELAAVIS